MQNLFVLLSAPLKATQNNNGDYNKQELHSNVKQMFLIMNFQNDIQWCDPSWLTCALSKITFSDVQTNQWDWQLRGAIWRLHYAIYTSNGTQTPLDESRCEIKQLLSQVVTTLPTPFPYSTQHTKLWSYFYFVACIITIISIVERQCIVKWCLHGYDPLVLET